MDSLISLLTQGTGLSLWAFFGLCGISFVGSLITASLGLGGGLLVLATMTLALPPAVLIPLHGVVQLGSNGFRALLMRREILFSIIPAFTTGSLIGAAIGGQAFVALETWVLQAVLGVFVLYVTWAPGFRRNKLGPGKFFGLGVFGGFLTMFVGGTGPLVAPFVSAACERRQQMVATHAALMTFQHSFKVVAFGFMGFAFGSYIPLLVGLLAFGVLGTYGGRMVLNRLPEQLFRTILRIFLTLLAIRLLYAAATEYFV